MVGIFFVKILYCQNIVVFCVRALTWRFVLGFTVMFCITRAIRLCTFLLCLWVAVFKNETLGLPLSAGTSAVSSCIFNPNTQIKCAERTEAFSSSLKN